MFLGIDDTDSRTSGCTTYIGFQIAAHFTGRMNEFPKLVRLNPNLPYKTRGNGSVSLSIGNDGDHIREIGAFRGEPIFVSNSKESIMNDASEIAQFAESVVRRFYVAGEENTNPGIVVVEEKLPEKLYRMALEMDVCKECVKKVLAKHDAKYIEMGNGRGIIGSAASIAWPGKRHTYELLAYAYPQPQHIDENVKSEITQIANEYDSTFNNGNNEKTCLFPRERTPVIYGIRGTRSEDLMKIQKRIGEKYPEFSENYMIYKSNQGTDDHIIPYRGGVMREYASYSVTGRISKVPQRKIGGHVYFSVVSLAQEINCIVFEPSKSFRDSVEKLEKNDRVTLYGSYGLDHLKIEKLRIVSKSTIYFRKAPRCEKCMKIMHNEGNLTYECKQCGLVSEPTYEKKMSPEVQLAMEPPPYARRHLSMPWKLEGVKLEEP